MARLVAGLGVPHTPMFPDLVLREGPTSETGGFYRQVAERLEAARPDLLVVFTADHLWKFFFDNLPTFCIGVEDQAEGPEPYVKMPHYQVEVRRDFAAGLLKEGLAAEFDLASTEEFGLDHSTLVPLHFLTPRMHVPIVPIFIKGLCPPLPRATRCFALGCMLRRFIDAWPGQERVVVLASGSFSLEVGGPKIGVVDLDWTNQVLGHVAKAESGPLIEAATSERMLAAGNVSGELLNWIALMGTMGDSARVGPSYMQRQEGHAYVFWPLETA